MDAVTPQANYDTGHVSITPFDLTGLKTYELKSRPSKVFVEALGQPFGGDLPMSVWFSSLPRIGAGDQFCRVLERICQARRERCTVVAALGGRAIESGCGPYVADWVRRGIVQAIVLTGGAAIHDFELAACGKTSEDAADEVACGRYGMARETADAFAIAARAGADQETGLGFALGRHIADMNCAHSDYSVVLAAYQAGIPCTIHVSMGADTVHMHPHVCGAALGAATMIDFRRLCSVTTTLAQGVWLNMGSAVAIPETFLKAVSVVRNFGHSIEGLLTVNIDSYSHNQTDRRALAHCSSDLVELVGHHELMLPLLHAAVACQQEAASIRPAQAA